MATDRELLYQALVRLENHHIEPSLQKDIRKALASAPAAEPVQQVSQAAQDAFMLAHGDAFEPHLAADRAWVEKWLAAQPAPQAGAAEPVGVRSAIARLESVALCLRSTADRGREQLGDGYPEILQSLDTVKASLECLRNAAPPPAEPAQPAPQAGAADVVAWQVRRIDRDGGPLSNWEPCTQDLYDDTLTFGRYGGFENGPPCEVRALTVAATPGATHGN